MSTDNCYQAYRLPDVEIYGGDNTTWEVLLMNPDRTPIAYNNISKLTAVLTFLPYKIVMGQGYEAEVIPPVLTLYGEIAKTETGVIMASFYFAEEDTKMLRGKYVYQIEVTNGYANRVSQGHVIIKHNIHR